MSTISPARSEAARRNGAKSKGSKTEEGKARSSLNALKHGLCSAKEIVAPGDPEGFPLHQAALHAQYQPRNPMEVLLVERIVACSWRLRRVVHMQAAIIGGDRSGAAYFERYGLLGHTEVRFMNLCRYESALERSLYRAIKALKEERAQKYETNPSPFARPIPDGIHIPDLDPLEEELPNEPKKPEPEPSTPEHKTERRNEPKPTRKQSTDDIQIWTPKRKVNNPYKDNR